jgi:hypothetical protein
MKIILMLTLFLLAPLAALAAPFAVTGLVCFHPWEGPSGESATDEADRLAHSTCAGAKRIGAFSTEVKLCPTRAGKLAEFATATYECNAEEAK